MCKTDAHDCSPLAEEECFAPALTGPGTLAGRYLRSFWQPIYVSSELSAGEARPICVMGQRYTLFRSVNGEPRVVAYRCAHRGTQLSVGTVEDDCIRCFYHGWKYNGDGRCVEQPAEKVSFASKVRIASYPVQDYLGLVFAYFGEGEVPELQRFRDLEGSGILECERIACDFNYFNEIENAPDEMHVYFAHRGLLSHRGEVILPTISCEETEYGFVQYGVREYSPVTSWVTHILMPNCGEWLVPPDPEYRGPGGWRDSVYWWVPIDDFSHFTYNVRRVRISRERTAEYMEYQRRRRELLVGLPPPSEVASAVLAGKCRVQDVRRPDATWIQDHVAQAGQGVIADRSTERLGSSDVGVVLLRRLWNRELSALASGATLKRWVRPGSLNHMIY